MAFQVQSFGLLVSVRQPLVDRVFQVPGAVKGSPAYHAVGGVQPEPAFHLIESGTATEDEAEVKALLLSEFEPPLDRSALVDAIVVDD